MVAFDIDGTLVDSAGVLRPSVRDAVRAVMAEGVLVTLATGRRFQAASEVASELGVELPLVLHGGTLIQDSLSAEVIYEDVIPLPALGAVVRAVEAAGHQPVLYRSPSAGSELLAGPPERDSEAAGKYLARQPHVRRLSYEELPRHTHVISVGVFEDEDVMRPLLADLARNPAVTTLYWEPDPNYADYPYLVDVVNKGCSKAKALAFLAESYGVTMAEVMAIGDQVNDLDMISAVGLGVAMGNAIQGVRDRARVVVGTNDEDGVVEALRRFVLGDESPA